MNGYGNSVFLRTAWEVSSGGTPPANTVAPVISGTQVVGSTLTSTTGTWTGTPVIVYTYQWFRGATLIGGATSSTYVLVQADAGNTSNITCKVTGTNAFGNATATSNTLAQIFDFDANAFITSAVITDTTQKAATNSLTIDLKGYSIWSKMKALYPFVGGTATTHKFNLKDPRDLDAAFRLTYGGGLTHSSNGITGNGLNGFANTKWIQNVNGTLNNQSIGIYTRTNNNFAGIDMGARIGATSDLSLAAYGGSPVVGRVNTYANSVSITGTPQGFFQTTRTGGASQTVFLNASYVTTAISTSTAILDMPIYLFAMNVNFADLYHTNRNYAFAYIADGLTIAEAGNLRTAVQAFQTTLGRQV